jgi:hypothetical protein
MALLRFFNLSLSWREWEATVAARGQSASLTAELLRAVAEGGQYFRAGGGQSPKAHDILAARRASPPFDDLSAEDNRRDAAVHRTVAA